MFKPLVAAVLLATGAVAALPADAQSRAASPGDWGTYVGAAIGDSDLDTTLKLFGGASVTQNWGWEASYIDFGSRDIRGVTTEAWGLGAALVGVLPLNQGFSAFGKLGAYYVKSEARTAFARVSDSDVELGAGVGLRYAVTPQVSLRLEFESIGGEGGDVVSVGVQARF
jgi:opacity protein-like surface antigen